MGVDAERISSAAQRRALAIDVLRTQLDARLPGSAAARLASSIDQGRRAIIAGGDIDGVVSACMLASVAHEWDIVAFVVESEWLLVHPTALDLPVDGLFGLDVFSPQFDNVSNHVVLWGSRKLQRAPATLSAFRDWDKLVLGAAQKRLLAVPSIWAQTEASRDTSNVATSSVYKYPLGTAQLLLALLESCGRAPRFFDREFLPWLVANCDGGVRSYAEYYWNVGVWWPVLAAAVGPASLSEHVYSLVKNMRPHDFTDAVNKLEREGGARGRNGEKLLDDKWKLRGMSPSTLADAVAWLTRLTGWRDPIRGGLQRMSDWRRVELRPQERGSVPLDAKALEKEDAAHARVIRGAWSALNANFQHWQEGDRFGWVGRWPPAAGHPDQ